MPGTAANAYEVSHDSVYPVIRARMTGFWTTEMVESFGRALGAAFTEQATRSRVFFLLIDCRTYPLQSQEVNVGFDALRDGWPSLELPQPAGMALVVNAVIDLDEVRQSVPPDALLCRDPAVAMAWVDAQLAAIGSAPTGNQPSADGSTA